MGLGDWSSTARRFPTVAGTRCSGFARVRTVVCGRSYPRILLFLLREEQSQRGCGSRLGQRVGAAGKQPHENKVQGVFKHVRSEQVENRDPITGKGRLLRDRKDVR